MHKLRRRRIRRNTHEHRETNQGPDQVSHRCSPFVRGTCAADTYDTAVTLSGTVR
jgi:hypothetical protein